MSISSVLLLCTLTFSVAVVLISIINRPTVVIQPERNSGNNMGCMATMGVLLLLAVGFIWILLSDRPSVSPSKENRERVQLPDEKRASTNPAREERATEQTPIASQSINRPVANWSPAAQTAESTTTYVKGNTDKAEITNHHWIILVDRFNDKESALLQKRYFPTWKMEIYDADNGEYWNCALVNSEAEGYEMVKKWRKEAGYSLSTGPEMKIMRVNVQPPKQY